MPAFSSSLISPALEQLAGLAVVAQPVTMQSIPLRPAISQMPVWCQDVVDHYLRVADGMRAPVTRASGGGLVECGDGLVVHIQAGPDEDGEELAGLAQRLRARLLDLDVDSVGPVEAAEDTSGAKGLGAVLGALVVRFGTVDGLRSVLAAVSGWAARTGHSVEVSYGEDRLMVTRVTSAQQERIIDDFISRHAPGP